MDRATLQQEQTQVGATVRALAGNLWLPAVFLAGLIFCYLPAFHHATPHGVRIAVAAPAHTASTLQAEFDRTAPGAFDLRPVDSVRAARGAVLHQDTVAAWQPDAHHPQLYLAKADGASLETVLENAVGAATAAQHPKAAPQLQVHELVPTLPDDASGTTGLYLALACTLPCYFMVVSLQRAGFSRRKQVLTYVCGALVIAAVSYLVPAYGYHAVPKNPLILLYLCLMAEAVTLTSFGLVAFFGRFFPAVAVVLFMMLGMPSSGGTVPTDMVPAFFRFLHPVLPMGNVVDAVRDIGYFHRENLLRPTLALSAWIALGALLILLGWVKELARTPAENARALPPAAPVDDPTMEMPLCTLTGRATDRSGLPLAGATITVTTEHGRGILRTTTTADGSYTAAGLHPGSVIVLATAPGHLPSVTRVRLHSIRPVHHQDFSLDTRYATNGLLPV
ncbi:carboxypeptidase regulatory-like domain-containing protein [Streptomyces sp. NPDC006012]|uniref:carboxypeptidase regulatory-like domain-containing protein n=1 Tax=Streptomyces sp. NPDC006012 TaxID=3364739 RepID=UPI0036CDA3D8